jgi:hypothetical protein
MWTKMLALAREAAGLKPSYTGKTGPDYSPAHASRARLAKQQIITGKRDWPVILGSGFAILLAILGLWLVAPIRPLGAVAGAIIGWYLGSTLGRLF